MIHKRSINKIVSRENSLERYLEGEAVMEWHRVHLEGFSIRLLKIGWILQPNIGMVEI